MSKLLIRGCTHDHIAMGNWDWVFSIVALRDMMVSAIVLAPAEPATRSARLIRC